jgi:hypothetical protein
MAIGSSDAALSRKLFGEMIAAVEGHPGEVGGWQTAVVGLMLQTAFAMTKEVAARDPQAARSFCVEVLGLPDEMVRMMDFGG